MPNPDTFDCKPLGQIVVRYLSGVSIDPFARNKRIATYTNDLNPGTAAVIRSAMNDIEKTHYSEQEYSSPH